MGRTPRINGNGGRDHFGNLTSLLFAGGGLKMGQVIGQSDSQASRPAGNGYTPRHLLATIMATQFDLGVLRLQPQVPTKLLRYIEDSHPIDGLL